MSVLIDYSSGAFAANQAQGVGTVTAGTGTYNLAVASYDGVSFAFGTQDAAGTNIQFTPDGTKMILLGITNDDLFEYSLSTAWDISTASYTSNSFDLGSQATNMYGAFFRSDGTKIYVLSIGGVVYQYSMSTAWDITTASYDSTSFSVSSQAGSARDLWLKPDGTKMYVVDAGNDSIYQYTLSTAWDISTASYDSVSLSVSSQDSTPISIYFKPDGASFWLQGFGNNSVYQYTLTTAWDLSTASYSSVSFSTSTQTSFSFGMTFGSGGSKMYISDNTGDVIYQYSTGTATSLDISSGTYFNYAPSANTTFTFANPPVSGTAAGFALAVTGANAGETYDIANASYDSVNFSVSSQDTTPTGIYFKTDGTAFYVSGRGNWPNAAVHQYSLSTAWDISTASYANKTFNVGSQSTFAECIQFKSDGTTFYIIDKDIDKIFQYSLSTAWDVSTASYASKSLDVRTREVFPTAMFFKSDGTKVYITGAMTDTIYQYSLSTAWDISTGSYGSKSFSVSSQLSTPQAMFFNPNGDKVWVIGSSNRRVYQYSLSTAWDISTASYDSISFLTHSLDTEPYGLAFKNDGSKMYTVGAANDKVYQFSTGSSATATFSYPASVKWPSGTAPDGPAIGETDVLVFYTDDGGNTYQGFRAGNAMS